MKKVLPPVNSALLSTIDNYPPPQEVPTKWHLSEIVDKVVLEVLKYPHHDEHVIQSMASHSSEVLNQMINTCHEKSAYKKKVLPLIKNCVNTLTQTLNTQKTLSMRFYFQISLFISSMNAADQVAKHYKRKDDYILAPVTS